MTAFQRIASILFLSSCAKPDSSGDVASGSSTQQASVAADSSKNAVAVAPPSFARSVKAAPTVEPTAQQLQCPGQSDPAILKQRPVANLSGADFPRFWENLDLTAPSIVRLRMHNTGDWSNIDSFAIDEYPDSAPLNGPPVPGDGTIRPVSPSSVGVFYDHLGLEQFGLSRWVAVGYFTGRVIDIRELKAAQYGQVQRDKWWPSEGFVDSRAPEFCVLDWCIIPDPNPGRPGGNPKDRPQMAEDYRESLRKFLKAGGRVCTKEEQAAK